MTADTDKEYLLIPSNSKCLICNVKVSTSPRGICNIFQTNVPTPSQKQLVIILAAILECDIIEDCVHSQVICKKCYKLIHDFDDLEVKLADIKQSISNKYKETLKCHELDKIKIYEQCNKDVLSDSNTQEQSEKNNLPLNEEDENVITKLPKERRHSKAQVRCRVVSDTKEDEQKENNVLYDLDRPISPDSDSKFDAFDFESPEDEPNQELHEEVFSESASPKTEEANTGQNESAGGEDKVSDIFVGPGGDLSELICLDKQEEKFECKLCKENSSSVREAETHLRIHNLKVSICEYCGMGFRRRSALSIHLDFHMNENGEFSCDFCSKVFNSRKQLKEHRKIHFNKNHACEECGKRYGSRRMLEEHKNAHNGIRPYQCQVCLKDFASKYCWKVHTKIHDVRPRPHSCSDCGKTFLSSQHLQQHEKTHSAQKDFVCETCGKAFGTARNLEVHNVVHTGLKPHSCIICKKAFARRAEINDHMRTHTGEKPFQCELCGATFSQRSNLQSHKRATHFDDKRFKCEECGKGFKRRRLLDYHKKSIHTGERPFRCEMCEAAFVYPEHYKKHIRIHTGEKPFKCEVCGKAFNSRDNRNAHRFIHSDKKPYECVVCGMGFMRKPLLYSHMQSQGHLQDAIVINQPRLPEDNTNDEANCIEANIDFDEQTKAFLADTKDAVIIPDVLPLQSYDTKVKTNSENDPVTLGANVVEHLIIETPLQFSDAAMSSLPEDIPPAIQCHRGQEQSMRSTALLVPAPPHLISDIGSLYQNNLSPVNVSKPVTSCTDTLINSQMSPTPVQLLQIRIPQHADVSRSWQNFVSP